MKTGILDGTHPSAAILASPAGAADHADSALRRTAKIGGILEQHHAARGQ